MKLLRPFAGTGAVFFPVGLPPVGTCQYATSACLQDCYILNDTKFDEDVRRSSEELWLIHDGIMSHSVAAVVKQFLSDLDGLQVFILHWFASGDCIDADLEHISAIIKAMPGYIVQMGFTRNHDLWERHKDIFALTIEDMEDTPDPNAMYAIPIYAEQVSVMHVPAYEVRSGFCGALLCQDRDRMRYELEHYTDCRICYRLKMGCFDRREHREEV